MRLLAVIVSLLWLGTSGAFADLWYEHYIRGEDAVKAADWKTAVNEFTESIQQKAEPQLGVRTYGMNFIDYLPYLKLGIAYYNLGEFEKALRAFDTEESFGVVKRTKADAGNLIAFRKLAEEEAQKLKRLSEAQQLAAVVERSLGNARAAEEGGRLDEAMAAAAAGLAVAPGNEQLVSVMARLRLKTAAEQSARDTTAEIARELFFGRDSLASRKYESASSAFSKVLSLEPGNAEAQQLLAESQAKLKESIEAENSLEARRALTARTLGAVESLLEQTRSIKAAPEALARIDQGLRELQSVLAVESGNRRAMDLQTALLRSRVEIGAAQKRTEDIAGFLEQADGLVKGGRYDAAVVALSRAIALDPANSSASKYLAQAYRGLNETVMAAGAPAPPSKRPPMIVLANAANAQETIDSNGPVVTLQAEVVSADSVIVSGVVLDDQPGVKLDLVRILTPGSPADWTEPIHPALHPTKAGDLYQYRFSQVLPLAPGVSVFTITASDSDGLSDEKSYGVRYARPAWKSPWLYGAAGLAVIGALGVAQGARVRRRNRFLKRRFNPYIAGAPVLADNLFLGREVLLSRILQTVHNNSILLYGERRIGKTSVQHHLRRRLEQMQDPEYEFYPVFIDLQGTPEHRFFATLAHEIFGELGSKLDGKAAGPAGMDDAAYTYELFVRDVHSVIKTLRQQSRKKAKLVLLIDEVDELNGYDPKINQKLRSLFMKSFAEDLRAVVSGVGIRKEWASEGSPWYNFFEEIEVKPFRREDAADLIERPIQGIFRLEDGVVDRIIEKTDCKPYLIQKLCVALVNRLHEERRRRITISDVEAIALPQEG